MALEGILENIGFTAEQASYLSNHDCFNHKRKNEIELTALLQGIAKVYSCDEAKVKAAVLKQPQFAGLDHQRVVDQAIVVYGFENEAKVKAAVLKQPQFAGYDHQRVVDQAIVVYGSENEAKVKTAILKFPPFAGLDHQRVFRQKGKLGRIVGLNNEEAIEKLLSKPALTSYSAKRYLAALDIARELEAEGFSQDIIMLRAFFSNYSKSPYVPKTNRKRISQVENGEQPPLLKAMRKYLTNFREK